MASVVGIVVTGSFLAWCGYLIFCGWLVKNSEGKSESLRDAATAAEAFPFKSLSWLGNLFSKSTDDRKPPDDGPG